ncbi:redoxin domain-containing protein [Alteribacter natronophilus]|uniref:redoxin domain-containing protein n=1 Tax=Alteribacter natronophilus TaxID=2583810 RepID=UPI00110EDC2D|nr:redoxin domain-containing protein [Alteribacter natronophilus]TMW72993.1 redoxin domain-containing protein [Alteribacter natronophilus]
MKKTVLILAFTVLIGWTIYDTVDWETDGEESAQETEEFEAVQETSGTEAEETVEEPGEEESNTGLEPGNTAPDFTLTTLSGEETSLSDYRGEKVMVNFWATWCPPCRAEMPDMEQIYTENDVTILAVNLTETEPGKDYVESFREELDLSFPILLDENIEVAGLYNIQPIPTSYFIDTSGRIHSASFGPMNHEMIRERFNEMD